MKLFILLASLSFSVLASPVEVSPKNLTCREFRQTLELYNVISVKQQDGSLIRLYENQPERCYGVSAKAYRPVFQTKDVKRCYAGYACKK